MPLTRNSSLIFAAIPKGPPVSGRDLIVEARTIDLDDVPKGGIIVRNMYNSFDPYMRLMLVGPKTQHYRQPYTIREPLRSLAVAQVIKSSHPDLPSGSLIRTSLPIQQYSALSSKDIESKQSTASSAKLRVLPSLSQSSIHLACWLGALGMPGLTAYASIFEIGQPQPGETIFVSSAAGAVGQIVGQICKIRGLKVIGSAGSAVKCDLLTDELGFDAAFNYKEESTLSALRRLAPDGIDIYYDNVGGKTLEEALAQMRIGGRIVICGMVSQYSSTSSQDTSEGQYGVKNLFQFVSKGLTMRGFQVGMKDFGPKYEAEFEEDMLRWLREGKIKAIMSEARGIEGAAQAFVAMLAGENIGKAVLRIDLQHEERPSIDEMASIYTRISA
jgi:NADPH-dependent curcumin reductase CurA